MVERCLDELIIFNGGEKAVEDAMRVDAGTVLHAAGVYVVYVGAREQTYREENFLECNRSTSFFVAS